MNFRLEQRYIGKRTTNQKEIMNFRLEQWYIGKRTSNQKKNNYELPTRTLVYRKKNKNQKKK